MAQCQAPLARRPYFPALPGERGWWPTMEEILAARRPRTPSPRLLSWMHSRAGASQAPTEEAGYPQSACTTGRSIRKQNKMEEGDA